MADFGVAFSANQATFEVAINTKLSDIDFSEENILHEVSLNEQNPNFGIKIDNNDVPGFGAEMGTVERVVEGADPYKGDYTVTPKVTAQTLETKDKVLRDDVTILEIPFFSTSNNSGGNTVYIGKEL